MPLTDIATVNVTSTTASVTRAGFGKPLILSHAAPFPERKRDYSSISEVDDDFAVNTPEYLAANAIFSQNPTVEEISIGRALLQPTQQYAIGVQVATGAQAYKVRVAMATGTVFPSQDATYNSGGATGWVPSNTWSIGDLVIADGFHLYSCLGPSGGGQTGIGAASGPSGTLAAIREGGVYWMFAGSGVTGGTTNDAVINGLKGKVEALGAPTVIGTGLSQMTSSLQGSAGSRTLRLLANQAAKFFGVQVYNRNYLNIAQDHADPGVATDLAAIVDESNDWYGLVTLYNSSAVVSAAAGWAESNSKLYAAATCDSAVARVAEGASATDVAHVLKAANYARSWAFHHPRPDQFADAAEMGRFLPIDPGGETWRMKTLSGVTVENYSSTEITNMEAKRAHFYYSLGNVGVVGGDAKTASGEYVDVTRFIDWYESELQADLADAVIQNNKIPYTNQGIDLIASIVQKRNLAGIRAGGIAPDPAPTVSVPDVADVSAADKAARELNNVTSVWTLAGAIHHITVSVTASV